jgi:ADP-ribose pyrophosphatase YjhB (NUDIX family)
MKEYKVGASIIYHPDYYVMHRRKKGVDNGEVSKLGLYGGQFDPEHDGALQDTACRELSEESGMDFPVSAFEPQEAVYVVSERDGEEILTEAEIFLLNLASNISHDTFKHGEPLTARELRRAKALGELTSVAAEALSKIRGI